MRRRVRHCGLHGRLAACKTSVEKKCGLQGSRAQIDAINWVSARVSDIKEALEARVREYTR